MDDAIHIGPMDLAQRHSGQWLVTADNEGCVGVDVLAVSLDGALGGFAGSARKASNNAGR